MWHPMQWFRDDSFKPTSESWQEKAAREIQALCQSIPESEMVMGDMPPIEEIVRIIDKHFREFYGPMTKLISD